MTVLTHNFLGKRIILASASAIRAQLLTNAGLSFDVDAANIDEAALKQSMAKASIEQIALALAEAKAKAISPRHQGAMIIGADQMLELDGKAFDKPPNLDALRHQLVLLRGRTHRLISAFALVQDGMIMGSGCSQARLTMRQFSETFLDNYIEQHGEIAMRSVGGYQLEGNGVQLFSHVEGDYFTILGLPLLKLLALLRHRQWLEN